MTNNKYTLEEVKEIVASGKVDMHNLSDLINSLKDYDFNNDIKNIFITLSNNENLPESIRNGFKSVVDSYSVTNDPVIQSVAQEEAKVDRPPIQQYRPTPRVGYQGERDDEISLENDAVLGGLVSQASKKGLKVLSSNPGVKGKPEISFELNYESKPYIDNLLLSLDENKEDIDVDLTRVASSGKEVLTLEVDNPNLSETELREKGKNMFNSINNIISETDKNKDYESKMPSHLKALKDKFHNDDPHIPNEDFTIGYSRQNGENTYYVIANSKEQAIEVAELMGYGIKKDRGGNVFEIDPEGKPIENSKLDDISENVNQIDEIKDTEEGLTDVDVNYNNKHFVENDYSVLESITKNGQGEIKISTPDATANQRVVEVTNNLGESTTVVFDDGKAFDNYAARYEQNYYSGGEQIHTDTGTTTEYNYGGEEQTNSNEYTYSKPYVKTLGTYPSRNNSQAANTSFMALVVFILVLAIGFGVIYLLFGG